MLKDSCDEYKCDGKPEYHCCLCEHVDCEKHSHFVDIIEEWHRYVCDTCYQTVMIAFENEQKARTIYE